MPSPFPGMNPYLEQEDVWQDFHQSFIPAARGHLAEQVDPDYIVKVEEHLYIHELPADQRAFIGRADVSVATRGPVTGTPQSASATAAPAYVRLSAAIDVERQAFLEVRDRRSRDLVAVIELLSPTNKRPGPDREQYMAKRLQILSSGSHLIEIDLLRGGARMPSDEMPACDYCVLVSRAEERPRAGFWPIALTDPLPRIPIPLRPPHPDAQLDLARVLNRVYDDAHYEHYIYASAPQPPLAAEQEGWARSMVARG